MTLVRDFSKLLDDAPSAAVRPPGRRPVEGSAAPTRRVHGVAWCSQQTVGAGVSRLAASMTAVSEARTCAMMIF
jgi:hypothetical protein